jgi:hypothetical protein
LKQLLAFLFAFASPALALNPALDISQYVHTSWKIVSGFARAIVEDGGGTVWIAKPGQRLCRLDHATARAPSGRPSSAATVSGSGIGIDRNRLTTSGRPRTHHDA